MEDSKAAEGEAGSRTWCCQWMEMVNVDGWAEQRPQARLSTTGIVRRLVTRVNIYGTSVQETARLMGAGRMIVMRS